MGAPKALCCGLLFKRPSEISTWAQLWPPLLFASEFLPLLLCFLRVSKAKGRSRPAATMRPSRLVPPQALQAPACWSICGGARRRWRTWASSSPARSCSKGPGEPPPPQSATHCCTIRKRFALPAWLRGREQEGQARAAALAPCARSAPPKPPVMQVGHRLGGPLHGQRPGPVLGSGRQERQRRLLMSSGAARQRNGWRQAERPCARVWFLAKLLLCAVIHMHCSDPHALTSSHVKQK
jgi:hypothetical protein